VIRHGHTRVVANEYEIPTADFTRDRDAQVDREGLLGKLGAAAGESNLLRLNAQATAARFLGDPIGSNILLMGYAWQQGLVPVGLPALMRAIELNGVAVDMNKRAFTLGRLLAADSTALEGMAQPAQVIQFAAPKSLDEMLAFRVDWLTRYQNAAYAEQYRQAVAAVERREVELEGGGSRRQLSKAVARNLFKVMAYKDEYEVARLHADPAFRAQIAAQFDGDYKLAFHLAPPLLARRKPGSDVPAKMAFGGWLMPVFGMLARFKGLRGTKLDPFGYTHERKAERALRDRYLAFVRELATGLRADNKEAALKLAALPDQVRGYGHIKQAAMTKFDAQWAELAARYRNAHVVELKRRA
jgi:indolepyruvate ferredoxin oxidoreductase